MNRVVIVVILLVTNLSLIAQPKVTNEEINELFLRLEESNFFRYVLNKEEIAAWKNLQTKHLSQYGWLVFPSRSWIIEEQTGEKYSDWNEPFDYYFLDVDGDNMFRGSLKFYFEQAAKLFEVRNLKLEIGEEYMNWGVKDDSKNYHYFKHEIEINGNKLVFSEGNLNYMGALTYIRKFHSILKEELEKQSSKEKIVMITSQDGGSFLIAEDKVINVFKTLPGGIENKIIEE